MKKLLGILVLGLLLSGKANSDDFYLQGASPRTLVDMGYKLFSVEPVYDGEYESKKVLYTFIKENSIATCRVYLEPTQYKDGKVMTKKDHSLLYPTRCFNITNIVQESFYKEGNE